MSISMEVPSSWDALRKQARKLEAQLDEQMNSFRKLVSTKVSTNVDTAESDVESGIERLLKQLQQVNSQMQAWVSSGGSEMVSHTLTRHQEILQDLTQEFYRLRSGLRAKQEHASLLDDFREFDRSRLELEDGLGTAEQTLLKEHASISRSTGQMDNVISQAQATLGALVFQRSTFGGINSKLSNVSSRLPSVNHILAAIKRKKSMDTIILSLVASVCTFLIFIYWLTKGRMGDDEDPWLAPDKLYHFLLCFTLTIFFAGLAVHTRYPFIRRHSILIGSVLSLFAGAAKEVADELGFFKSAGASARDAVADLIGVLIASFLLHALRFSIRSGGVKEASPNRDISMV